MYRAALLGPRANPGLRLHSLPFSPPLAEGHPGARGNHVHAPQSARGDLRVPCLPGLRPRTACLGPVCASYGDERYWSVSRCRRGRRVAFAPLDASAFSAPRIETHTEGGAHLPVLCGWLENQARPNRSGSLFAVVTGGIGLDPDRPPPARTGRSKLRVRPQHQQR
jgi:hypothetical protein